MIGIYHDSILEKEASRQQPQATTLFNRYSKSLLKRNSLYRKLAFLLLSIRAFEVVAEMFALKKFGKKAKDRIVLTIEIAKLILRMLMMRTSGNKMILHSELPERTFDLAKLKPHEPDSAQNWKGKRTDKEFFPVDCFTQVDGGFDKSMDYLLSKAMIEPSGNATDLVHRLNGVREFGEYLYLFRPLLYCKSR
jgi:hypothetical protein